MISRCQKARTPSWKRCCELATVTPLNLLDLPALQVDERPRIRTSDTGYDSVGRYYAHTGSKRLSAAEAKAVSRAGLPRTGDVPSNADVPATELQVVPRRSK